MIYIKRFCFVIVGLTFSVYIALSVIFGVLTMPIWGLIYYILTGDDPFKDDCFDFIISPGSKLFNWYCNKFGPNYD